MSELNEDIKKGDRIVCETGQKGTVYRVCKTSVFVKLDVPINGRDKLSFITCRVRKDVSDAGGA